MPGNIRLPSVFAFNFVLQNNWPSFAMVGQFFNILLWVVVVALLAYYTTRIIASAHGRRGTGKHNLEIVESMGVGAQSAVQILRVGEKFFLIGVTKEKITLLAELDETQITKSSPRNGLTEYSFEKILQQWMHKNKSNQAPKQDAE